MQDKRIQRTQHVLAQALIALTLEKGYESISIRDLTAYAGVGYATFFRHYPDKDALLLDVVDVVLDEVTALLEPQMATGAPEAVGTLLFQYVQEHTQLCRVLLGSHGSAALRQRIHQAGVRNILDHYTPRPDSQIPPNIAANHLVASTLALVQWWLDHDMPYTPAQMGAIYRDLIVQPTLAVAFC